MGLNYVWSYAYFPAYRALYILQSRAGVKRDKVHFVLCVVEIKYRFVGDDALRASSRKQGTYEGCPYGGFVYCVAGAGAEI